MVLSTAGSHSEFVEKAQTGRGLACVENDGPRG